MKSLLLSAAAAAAVLAFWSAPAYAGPVPEGPTQIYLKDHPELPLDLVDDRAQLGTDPELWTFLEIETEDRFDDLGNYQIVHEESGQCLTVDSSAAARTAPILLADCEEADVWTIIFDSLPSHVDYRFVADEHYYLGLEGNGDAVEGAEVLGVRIRSGNSLHAQEWRFGLATEQFPPEQTVSSPPEEPSPSAVAAPQLPQAGAGLGAALGAGTVALAAGAGVLLWWQRRRALRAEW
ncbi:RICIN domain-containing protein [Glycomyces sp. NRRL B-16210]|uniref:RICIN domain-containing protein n=1 Tax=Glycomyces sp. NRRL B-16210 TaxID=1463821 RepID=UPI0004C0BAA0|nr:RICIN domain-containing protein [Glycomyces sp. NRRL B-16210]